LREIDLDVEILGGEDAFFRSDIERPQRRRALAPSALPR